MKTSLGKYETKFAVMIWDNEPLTSAEIAKRSEEMLGWKKTTSHTVLKRLCDKGLFKNEKGMVSSCVSKEEVLSLQSEEFVEDAFGGSLPDFVAAFITRKKPTKKETAELIKMLKSFKED